MKTFGYTARDGGGRLRKGTVRAEDRASAVRGLRAQGCVPLSVAEDRQGPGGPPKGRRALPWAVLAAAAALAGLWLLRGPAREVGGPANAGVAPGRATARAGARAVGIAPAAVQGAAIAGEVASDGAAAGGDGPSGLDAPGGDIPAAGEAVEEAPARPRRVFSTATEQVLGWIASSVPGNPPPILPVLPPHERAGIAAILERDIVLEDGDSEAATESKYNVAHAKQVLRQYLADGGTPEAFLAHYHGALAEAHREWREAQGGVAARYAAGDAEGAVSFYLEQGAALREKGIKPLVLPPQLRGLLGPGDGE